MLDEEQQIPFEELHCDSPLFREHTKSSTSFGQHNSGVLACGVCLIEHRDQAPWENLNTLRSLLEVSYLQGMHLV